MSKENKIIKDLKERNDVLKNQYMQEQARNYHLNYVVDKYKSVLDEIRKYIETHVKEHIHDDYDVTLYNSLNQDECDELLQILDKVDNGTFNE